MEVLYPRCAGLDVHAGSITACARIATGAQVTYEHRTVPTTTRGLLDLAEWLGRSGPDSPANVRKNSPPDRSTGKDQS